MQRYVLGFQDEKIKGVFQQGDCKFVQLSLEPGQGLAKHKTKHTLALIVLSGKIHFTVDEQTETFSASEMLTLEPSREHAVEAVERSTVLLVLVPEV